MKRLGLFACMTALLLCACDDDESFIARPDDGDRVQSSSSGKENASSSSYGKANSVSSSSRTASSSSVKDGSGGQYPEDRNLDIPAIVKGCKTEFEDNCKYGTLEDERDGQVYKTVMIGGREWMAENLNYLTYSGSSCYDLDSLNCEKYGRLYSWNAASTACPEGWSLPSLDEWQTLFEDVGGKEVAGYMLKSTEGWEYDGNGLDAFGFSMLPAGTCLSIGCNENFRDYSSLGGATDFWALEDQGTGNSHEAIRCFPYNITASCYWLDVDYRFSVRCIKK